MGHSRRSLAAIALGLMAAPAAHAAGPTPVIACQDLISAIAAAGEATELSFAMAGDFKCTEAVTIPSNLSLSIINEPSLRYRIDVGNTSTGTSFDSMFMNGGSLILDNVLFRGLLNQHTRAIYSGNGKLVIKNCGFEEFMQRNGAVIYASGSTVDISGSSFQTNTANYKGGAIFADSTDLTVSESNFQGNSAVNSGGDIYGVQGVTMTVTTTRFQGSVSEYDAASISGCGGTFDACRFVSNQSPQSGAVVSSGDNCPPLSITNSFFMGNSASAEGGTGGAVRALQTDLSISDTEFDSNFAAEAGAAIYFLTSTGNTINVDTCSFSSNQNGGLGEGSAIWLENSDVAAGDGSAALRLGSVSGSTCTGSQDTCEVADAFGNISVDSTGGCDVCVPGSDSEQSEAPAPAPAAGNDGNSRGIIIGLSVTLAVAVTAAVLAMFAYRRSRRRRYRLDHDDWADEY
ncbi:unnamed protein product [Phaeothamnion confervicola]